MKVLLIGASGNIGQALLAHDSYRLFVPTSRNPAIQSLGNFEQLNPLDQVQLRDLLRRTDCTGIVVLSCSAGCNGSKYPYESGVTNTIMPKNIAEPLYNLEYGVVLLLGICSQWKYRVQRMRAREYTPI